VGLSEIKFPAMVQIQHRFYVNKAFSGNEKDPEARVIL
jgi:hypothetical protein